MRRLACLLAFLGGLGAPAAGAAPTSPVSVERSVLDLAPVGATSLTITRAPTDDDRRDLFWAAWDEGPPGHWHTRLLLVRRERGAAIVVWRADRPDAYAPTLRPIPPWSFGTSVVMLLQVQ